MEDDGLKVIQITRQMERKSICYLSGFVDPSQIFKQVVIFFSSLHIRQYTLTPSMLSPKYFQTFDVVFRGITVLASFWGLPISVASCSICCQLNSLGETGNHGRILSKVNIQQTHLVSMIKWSTKHISLLILH